MVSKGYHSKYTLSMPSKAGSQIVVLMTEIQHYIHTSMMCEASETKITAPIEQTHPI